MKRKLAFLTIGFAAVSAFAQPTKMDLSVKTFAGISGGLVLTRNAMNAGIAEKTGLVINPEFGVLNEATGFKFTLSPGFEFLHTGSLAGVESQVLRFSTVSFFSPAAYLSSQHRIGFAKNKIEFGVGYMPKFKMAENNYWLDAPANGFPQIWRNTVQVFPIQIRHYANSNSSSIITSLNINTGWDQSKVQNKFNLNSLSVSVGWFFVTGDNKKDFQLYRYKSIQTGS